MRSQLIAGSMVLYHARNCDDRSEQDAETVHGKDLREEFTEDLTRAHSERAVDRELVSSLVIKCHKSRVDSYRENDAEQNDDRV